MESEKCEVEEIYSKQTVKVNSLNDPIWRQILSECLRKHVVIIANEKLTSNLTTQVGWKWTDGKIYSIQALIEEKQESP